MKQLLKVKVFNRIQEDKFDKDLEKWRNQGIRNIPYYGMYVFCKDNGALRKKGYVVSNGDSHKFYHTKEEVFINEGMRIHI